MGESPVLHRGGVITDFPMKITERDPSVRFVGAIVGLLKAEDGLGVGMDGWTMLTQLAERVPEGVPGRGLIGSFGIELQGSFAVMHR